MSGAIKPHPGPLPASTRRTVAAEALALAVRQYLQAQDNEPGVVVFASTAEARERLDAALAAYEAS